MNMPIRIAVALVAWLSAVAAAEAADEFVITVPTGQAAVQRLAPGQSAALVLNARVRSNNGSGMAMLYDPTGNRAAGYEITGSPSANCGPAQAVVQGGRPMIGLPLTAPAGSNTFTCTYQVRRLPGSRDARILVCEREFDILCLAFGWEGLTVGDVPDFAIRVEPVAPAPHGATSALVRVVASNPTPWPVAARQVGTDCEEFGGGIQTPGPPFEIENAFPGGCPAETVFPVTGCVNLGGQNYSARNYRIENIPAGGEASCLLRLQLVRPLQGPVSIGLQAGVRVAYADTGLAYDVDRGNDVVPLGIAPPAFAAAVPSLDRHRAALLALAVLALAALRAGRRGIA
jgi:hypothetical protein